MCNPETITHYEIEMETEIGTILIAIPKYMYDDISKYNSAQIMLRRKDVPIKWNSDFPKWASRQVSITNEQIIDAINKSKQLT